MLRCGVFDLQYSVWRQPDGGARSVHKSSLPGPVRRQRRVCLEHQRVARQPNHASLQVLPPNNYRQQ